MDLWQLIILGLLGLLGGSLAGLVGIGGAVIFVPALVYVVGWPIKEAVGASLVITVFTAFSGTVRGIRSEDAVDWRVFGLLSCVPSRCGRRHFLRVCLLAHLRLHPCTSG